MLRLILGSNVTILRRIINKWTAKMLRKNGLASAKLDCKDFAVYRDGDEIMLHFNGDIRVNEEEFLKFVEKQIDGDA